MASTLVLLVVLVVCATIAPVFCQEPSPYCSLLINEINTDSPDSTVPSLFIEIRRVYTRKPGKNPHNALTDHFLLIIRAHEPAVVFFMDLSDEQLIPEHEDLIFVVGDPGLPAIGRSGIALNHPNIWSIYKNRDSERLLPKGDDSPYAILLLYAKGHRRDVKNFRPNKDHEGNYVARTLNDRAEISRLYPFIKDMVVYGRKAQASHCEIFNPMWPAPYEVTPDRTYILRDFDTVEGVDLSLNRCNTNGQPFQVESWQYDTPTPGLRNPCEGYHVFIEDIIDQIANMNTNNQPEDEIPSCSATVPGIPAKRYGSINEAMFDRVRQKALSCTGECDHGISSIADDAMEIEINNGKIRSKRGIPVEIFMHVDSEWKPEMQALGAPYLTDGDTFLRRTDVQEYLRIQSHDSTETPVTFHCAICMYMFGADKVDHKLREKITSEEGYFNPSRKLNRDKIESHAQSAVHVGAVEWNAKFAKAESVAAWETTMKNYENSYEQTLKPTVNMIRTVFAEALAESPFMYHPIFVDLQEANEVKLGIHHYSRFSAHAMTLVISDGMHQKLLFHLIHENVHFAMIVDASTSTMNIPYFIVYIQTTEDGYPFTYFYSLIELPEGESSEAIFNSFWEKVEKDNTRAPGFKNYVMSNLKILVSDNAASMVGKTNSFLKHLESKLRRQLITIGCMAHKLSLALKAALHKKDPEFEFIHQFESNLNDLYIFYQSRGSKRLQHLSKIADEFGIGLKRFKKNIAVRWSAGEFSCVDAILTNLDVVREDLLSIQTDTSYTKLAQDHAASLYTRQTDRQIVLLYHEFHDFLEINQVLSKTLQEREGLLLDHYQALMNAHNNYVALKDGPGTNMIAFLKTCVCPVGRYACANEKCTLEQVDMCENGVLCNNVRLENHGDPNFHLTNVRSKIYENLVAKINEYFNIPLIEAISVFDNREFDTQFSSSISEDNTRKTRFGNVCQFLGFEKAFCDGAYEMYVILVGKIKAATHSKLHQSISSKPSKFWPMVLRDADILPVVEDNIKQVLRMLMITGSSSAEAERGFSVMTRIDSGERAGLKPETLDGLMRIKLNGNKPIKDIDAFYYAHLFTRTHHAVDDASAGGDTSGKGSVYPKRVSRLF